MTTLKNNRPVIVGIFIIIALIILVVTVLTLGGQKKTFVKSFTLNAIFDDVSGLLPGENVWFSGVRVGTIKKITLYGDSQVKVIMSIENDAQAHIHKNAKAKIGSDGLIGNKIVVIYDGDTSKPPVEKNDYLTVDIPLTTDDMIATLKISSKNLLDITTDFKSISKKIDSGHGTLGSLLNDPAMANKLNATVDNLQATAANFKIVSQNTQHALSNIDDFSNKLNKKGSSLNGIVTDTGVYSSIKETMSELKNASLSVSQFTTNLKNTSDKLNQKDNTLDLLLNDTLTTSSVKVTLKNLESGSKKLDEDLEALQHNFLLRRFFKNKAKEKAKTQ